MALEARRTSPVMIQPAVRYALWCAAFLLSLSATRATPGTITGAVRHATEHTAISNAVVWAEPVGTTPVFPAPAQPAEMAQVHLAFVPRVLPVLAGTTVAFPNRDTVYHSVFSLTRHQRFEIGLYPPGESRSVTLDKPGLVKGPTHLPPARAGQTPCEKRAGSDCGLQSVAWRVSPVDASHVAWEQTSFSSYGRAGSNSMMRLDLSGSGLLTKMEHMRS
jgi:plastocyanin